jgi:hypothetical protein
MTTRISRKAAKRSAFCRLDLDKTRVPTCVLAAATTTSRQFLQTPLLFYCSIISIIIKESCQDAGDKQKSNTSSCIKALITKIIIKTSIDYSHLHVCCDY